MENKPSYQQKRTGYFLIGMAMLFGLMPLAGLLSWLVESKLITVVIVVAYFAVIVYVREKYDEPFKRGNKK